MRLTCPNCGARYEVDDAMIPPEGRDVQCSECSTTWFQPGRRSEARPPPRTFPLEEASEAEDREAAFADEKDREAAPAEGDEDPGVPEWPGAEPEETEAAPEDEGAPPPEATPEPEPDEAPAAPVPETAETATRVVPENESADAEPPEEEQAEEASSARRGLDPSVRDILREEAEREARLRQAEAAPVETQDEMPLESEPEDVHRARRRSELEDAEDAFDLDEASAAHQSNSRRDLLPDIEEINSTLRASGSPDGAAGETSEDAGPSPSASRRRGVRVGFLVTLAVAAGLFWLYVNEDLVSDSVPQAAPVVEGFTARVDAARFWLDDLAQDLAASEDAE